MNQRRQYISRDNKSCIYGKHVVDLAIEKRPDTVRTIFLSPTFSNERLLAKVRRLGCTVKPFPARKLPGGLHSSVNHQGIIAEINTNTLLSSYAEFMSQLTANEETLLLVLAEVQDPQNVGAMIRSAAAFGVTAVLLPQHNQATVTGAVAKVSAGMIFTVPLVQIKNVNTALLDLQKQQFRVCGLAGEEGAASIYETDFVQPSVLVVGNEGTGLRQKTREICDGLVQIPLHPQCESLNAAAAVTASLTVWRGQHCNR